MGATVGASDLPAGSTSLSCEGTPLGQDCQLLKQPLVVSFDSSISTVEWDLIKSQNNYYYAYNLLYNPQYNADGKCNATLCSNGVPFASSSITCSNVNSPGWTQLKGPAGFVDRCNQPVCPPPSADRPYYFGPDGTNSAGWRRTVDRLFDGRLALRQPERGHRVGTDAVLLAAAAPDGVRGLIVDVGAGVGAVGLALAQVQTNAQLVLLEKNAAAAAFARENMALNGLEARA